MTMPEILDLCITFIPSATIGILIGTSNHFRKSSSDESEATLRHFVGSALTSCTLSIAGFGIASHFTSDDVVCIGVASFVAILGVDRAASIFDKYMERKMQ